MADASSRPYAVVTGASSWIGYELAKVVADNGNDLLIAAEDAAVSVVGTEFGAFVETDLAAELNMIAVNVTSTGTWRSGSALTWPGGARGASCSPPLLHRRCRRRSRRCTGPTKAFVQSFSQALRRELSDAGVSVPALLPGPTETEFFDRAGMQDTKVGASSKDDPAKVAEQGFEALMAGKDQVLAGSLLSRLQGAAAGVTPEPLAAAAHRKLTEPGSAPDSQ